MSLLAFTIRAGALSYTGLFRSHEDAMQRARELHPDAPVIWVRRATRSA